MDAESSNAVGRNINFTDGKLTAGIFHPLRNFTVGKFTMGNFRLG